MKLPNAILASILALAAGAPAAAYMPDSYGPDEIDTISVLFDDSSDGACWTNISEARSYAMGKLKNRGHDVREDPHESSYSLAVEVLAERVDENGQDFCYYVVEAQVTAGMMHDGMLGQFLVGDAKTIGLDSDNANEAVIDVIQHVVDQM